MALVAAFWAGAALAWSLAAPPGPGNALMAQETARRGLAYGWAVGLGAITGDLLMLTLTRFGVLRILDRLPWLHVALGVAGALLMAYFAYGAWKSARAPLDLTATAAAAAAATAAVPANAARRAVAGMGGIGGAFGRGLVLILTSPFNLGWWLSAGTLTIQTYGALGMAGFFLGLLAWVAVWNVVAREGARRVRRFAHGVAYAAAGVLAVFAVVILVVVGGMVQGLLAGA